MSARHIRPDVEQRLGALAAVQDGVLTRAQVLAAGASPDWLEHRLAQGRWQHLHRGVVATFDGPRPHATRIRAALLRAGRDAVLSHETALQLWGVWPMPEGQAMDRDSVVHVAVPAGRRVTGQPPGTRVHRISALARLVHPVADPPRVRLEIAALQVAQEQSTEAGVVDVVLRAVQSRRTTAGRLRAELEGIRRHRWRRLLAEVLTDAENGVRSPLERRYTLTVERRHGLPRGERNSLDRDPATGRVCYRDVRYRRWGVFVELDGAEFHPATTAFRDRARDNAVVLQGGAALRFGWHEVAGDPCAVARVVALALQSRGWRGRPGPCGRTGCTAGDVLRVSA